MSEQDSNTKAAERIEIIAKGLEKLQHASDFLCTLAKFKNECETDPVELSVDTLFFFANIMGIAVDTISAELGMLKYEGKPQAEAYVRKPQAGAPEGFELDPEAQEFIFKDAERLQNMASELALVAEGLCHDLGLELPTYIKEKIAREKAARQEAA
jgi:hypothetical protein